MDAVYMLPEYYWGREPNDLCVELMALLPSQQAATMRLIDLGAGEGRDSIAFARHGFAVTALEVSAPGLAKARRWAAEEGLALDTVQASLLEYRLEQPVDVVYASGSIQHVPPELRAETFAHYKAMTRSGGVHAFNAFIEKPFISLAPDWQSDEYLYRSGELASYYWDWEILCSDEQIFDCVSSGVPHRHAMAVLIARKV